MIESRVTATENSLQNDHGHVVILLTILLQVLKGKSYQQLRYNLGGIQPLDSTRIATAMYG